MELETINMVMKLLSPKMNIDCNIFKKMYLQQLKQSSPGSHIADDQDIKKFR